MYIVKGSNMERIILLGSYMYMVKGGMMVRIILLGSNMHVQCIYV